MASPQKVLKKSSATPFDTPDTTRLPWIKPKTYGKGELSCRLLIVGESHYHKGGTLEDQREFTRNTIQRVMDGQRSAFFTKVAGLFNLNPSEFYPQVAFYNYLQQVMKKPRQPVSDTERRSDIDRRIFIEMLTKIRPDRVLILGKTNWRHLPSEYPDDPKSTLCEESILALALQGNLHSSEQNAYWYRTGSRSWALVGAIDHPSSRGFKPKHWRKWVKKFLEFDAPPARG
jgi:hypothetical protein